MTEVAEELTVIEQKHFAELVSIVDNGMKMFYEVGMALMQIVPVNFPLNF